MDLLRTLLHKPQISQTDIYVSLQQHIVYKSINDFNNSILTNSSIILYFGIFLGLF